MTEQAAKALHDDEDLLVVTSTRARRGDIARAYSKEYWGARGSRWGGSAWIRLLDRIILKEEVETLPDPKPNLFYDAEE